MNCGSGKCPLKIMADTTVTEYWNDSCDFTELSTAISNGAVGATSNPVIVATVLKKGLKEWEPEIRKIISSHPNYTEDEIAWGLIEKMGVKAAALLYPIFIASKGKRGRLSIQINPKYFNNKDLMVQQATQLNKIAPNLNIKLPVTAEGIEAIEELTYLGVSINATVSFTVSQSIAVAEAVERGLDRRIKEGRSIDDMSPICTIMEGRLDDWLKKIAEKKGIILNPGYLEWSGVAVVKRAYELYVERKYRTRLLTAAYRNHMHWSELIGGSLSQTIPYDWQVKFNASDVEIKERINDPIDSTILRTLKQKFVDFNRAYDIEGLKPEEFVNFGPTRRTLRQFLKGYEELLGMVRDILIIDPDVKGE
jgi:transaldolase